ncbi:hypothetical protein Leryth_013110 [Lithospermum erythrorhizon]|nr:hypothetical protein Leryth_013110 [Lithospermum erythrorhizon]
MIRRLKEHVLTQLPSKRRQIIGLVLKKSDIANAMNMVSGDSSYNQSAEVGNAEELDTTEDNADSFGSEKRLVQAIGIAKVRGFCEWLSIHPVISEAITEESTETSSNSHKMIIFAHYHKVFDQVQEFLCDKAVKFVRIDCNLLSSERQRAIKTFQSSPEVKIALIGIRAGGTGLNLSVATNVVFLELPEDPSKMGQAEDRAHRHGQTNAVNIYIFCAKDTIDEKHWRRLNKSLHRVSSTVDGKYDAVHEIKVHKVSHLEMTQKPDEGNNHLLTQREVTGKTSEGNTNLMLGRRDRRERDVEQSNTQTSCCDEDSQLLEVCHRRKSYKDQSDNSDVLCQVGGLDVENTVINPEHEGFAAKFNTETDVSSFCEMRKNSDDREDLETGDNNLEIRKVSDTSLSEEGRAGVNSNIQVNSLRFEMSQYTGRVHLYVCIIGVDARPKPLFENFLPEEIEALEPLPEKSKNMDDRFLKDDPRFRSALKDFVTEWNLLRPIERSKLVGKPLQVPLSAELSYLSESLNHDHGGLLKSRSKKRVTPSNEISHPLPSEAIWKEIHIYSSCGRKDKIYTQGWSCEDEPLCKLCQDPCRHNNAMKPEFFEDLFCNLDCYEEYRLRTSNRCVRQALFKIEHGICTNCHLDCHQLVKLLRPLSNEKRQDHIMKVAPNIAKRKKLMARLVHSPIDGNAWHADHIVPVYLGGGECRLENMRTLCVACHADVTSAQCADRRLARTREREQLKNKKSKSKAAKKSHLVDETEKDRVDDYDLFVHVPGSAYSEPTQNSISSITDAKAFLAKYKYMP